MVRTTRSSFIHSFVHCHCDSCGRVRPRDNKKQQQQRDSLLPSTHYNILFSRRLLRRSSLSACHSSYSSIPRVVAASSCPPLYHWQQAAGAWKSSSTASRQPLLRSWTGSKRLSVNTPLSFLGQGRRDQSTMTKTPSKAETTPNEKVATVASANEDDDKNNATDKATADKTIVEGSATMTYPADQEAAVFYNPVQVQNRDLSILMMVLYGERRAKRRAVARKRQQFKQEKQQQASLDDKNATTTSLKDQLAAYEKALQPSTLLHAPGQQPQAKAATKDNDNDELLDPGMNVLDALAASGLRSMRYWKEIPGIRHITINDLDPAAVDRAHTNAAVNHLTDMIVGGAPTDSNENSNNHDNPRPHGICIQQGDATHELYNSRPPLKVQVHEPPNSEPPAQESRQSPNTTTRPPWDVIDLDPYGSAAPFLDATVQAIQDGGFLCVTCTDMAALGGSHPETCFGRYAALPINRAGYLQELALRILLQSLATTAAKYGRTIRPILSVGMNFYVRVFCEVFEDKAAVRDLSRQLGHVYQSTQCPSFAVVSTGQLGGKKQTVYQAGRAPGVCPETGADYKVGGPLWMGPLHDTEVLQQALQRLETSTNTGSTVVYPQLKWIATKDRLKGLLQNCLEELPDVPLYYDLPALSKTLKISNPPMRQVRAALVHAGYRVSGYHKEPNAVKTNAPSTVVWDVMRAYCKLHPPKNPPPPDSVAHKILAAPMTTDIDFTISKEFLASQNKKTVARFPMNPQANWGPKPRASGVKRKAPSDSEAAPLTEQGDDEKK